MGCTSLCSPFGLLFHFLCDIHHSHTVVGMDDGCGRGWTSTLNSTAPVKSCQVMVQVTKKLILVTVNYSSGIYY